MKAVQQVPNQDTQSLLFDNMKALLRPKEVSNLLGIPKKTIYDWKYRAREKKVPEHLFIKLNGSLFLRTDILKDWFASENSQ